jgi:hypothetical protein
MTYLNPWPVTGNLVFDYFFTLVMYFGFLSVVPVAMFRLFRW